MATDGKSSKEVRTLLKKAKTNVDQSDYNSALAQLNSVLIIEPNNCNGMLMKGFVLMKLGETVEAGTVLWGAVALQGGLMSGWLGLKELYEREGGTDSRKEKESLCKVYTNLIGLYTDENKISNILEKLANLLLRLDRKIEGLNQFISYFSLCIQQSKQQQICKYWQQVMDICVNKTSKQMFNEIFPQIIDFYTNLSENGYTTDIIFSHLNMLYHKVFTSTDTPHESITHMLEVISQLKAMENIPDNIMAISQEIILVTSLVYNSEISTDRCEVVFNNNKSLFEMLKLVRQDQYLECFTKFEFLTDFERNILPGKWVKLKCLFGIYQFQELTELCYEELENLNRNQTPYWFQLWYKNEVLLSLAHSLIEMGCVKQCKQILGEFICWNNKQENNFKYLKIQLIISENNFEEALSLVESENEFSKEIKWFCLKCKILSEMEKHEKSIRIMLELTSENGQSPLCHLWLGLCYWKSGLVAREDKDKCLKSFLKSFSLDQLNYKPMQYIGLYYKTISVNQSKARKCFEKACQLAPWNNKLGKQYGDLLIDLGQEESALDFYRSLSLKISPNTGKWVWIRLGLSERKVKNYSETIRCFQNALNCDELDPRVLECLGEVYLLKGGLKGALASFEAVLKIEEHNLFCMYQIGCIKSESEEFNEAIAMFERVLELNQNYVPALLASSECHYQLASQSIRQGLFPVTISHIENGINLGAKCAKLQPNYSSVWYRIGEIGMLGRYFDTDTKFNLSTENLFTDKHGEMFCPGDLLELSIKCLLKCVALSPHHSPLLYMLSLAYYHSQTDNNQNVSSAYKYCVNAIILNDTDWKYWNLLGLILLNKEVTRSPLPLHCFIRSLNLLSHHATWTNVGYLYLSEGDTSSALKSFENARSLEPLSIEPWMGLAFVSQKLGKFKESISLLRHVCGMGYSEETAVWFGWKVCDEIIKTELKQLYTNNGDINQEVLEHLLLARDRLYHYTLQHPTNPAANNMLGVLLEMEGLYRSAVNSFEQALLSLDTNSKEYTMVATNLIRANNKAGTQEFNRDTLLSLPKTPSNILQQSVSLFYTKSYAESIGLLNELAILLDNKDDRNDVKLMIGLVANQARDQRVSKGTLAKLSKEKFPLHACAALCCIGFVYGDWKLIEVSVSQMHEVCCGDWGAPPCHNLPQIVLILTSLQSHYTSENEKGNIELIKKLKDLVTQLSKGESDWSTQRLQLLADLQNGVTLPICVPTPNAHIRAFIQPDPLDQSAIDSDTIEKITEPKEKLVPITTTKLLIRTAQKIIHASPGDVTNWIHLAITISYQLFLSPCKINEIPFLHILTALLRKFVEVDKEHTSLHAWCVHTFVTLILHSKAFGDTLIMKDFPSDVQKHHLTPVYEGLSSLVETPDPQLVELCKNKFQTQLSVCRYLAGRDNCVQALNGYKNAIMLGNSISNRAMVFALLEMALQCIRWFKRSVRDKVKFPAEINLHKIAKDNLLKSKQLFPEISELIEALKNTNQDLHSEFYFIQK